MTAIQLPSAIYRGIDTVHVLTPERCSALVALGYSWVARYIARDPRRLETPDTDGGDHAGCWTLSTSEARDIHAAGLGLVPVQWGPGAGDRITAQTGHLAGQDAAGYARWLGVTEGVHLWCDWEGARAMAAGAVNGRAYLEGWAAAVLAGGYLAGLYVSLPQPLSGPQLYGLRGYDSYWGAAQGSLPVPLPRGYAIQQELLTEVAGIPCDPDTLRCDCSGGMPYLWAA